MREDINFDSIDNYLNEFGEHLVWQSEDRAVCFSFDLALESLADHEIDRCVWALKKAIEVSTDGEGINQVVYQLLIETGLYFESIEVLNYLHQFGFKSTETAVNLASCSIKVGNFTMAEEILVSELAEKPHEYFPRLIGDLANVRFQQGRIIEAIALQREGLSIRHSMGLELSDDDFSFWNLSIFYESLGLIDQALDAAQSGIVKTPNIGEDWAKRISSIQSMNSTEVLEARSELADPPNEQDDFDDWFKSGSFWLVDIPKDYFAGQREFLEDLYRNGASWSDESELLFTDYWLDEESLDESLARVESLSNQIRLQPSWPVYLETPDLSIAMTVNSNFLLAWVGVGLEGLMVGINVKTWDVHHADDSDSFFAVGAVLNWFLDCSLNLSSHQMFDRMPNKWRGVERPWETKYLTTWSTTSDFHDDIENIRLYEHHRPPIAHRVRGHIRTLSERQPTDEARENAPAYIRRNMGPMDTFVRSYMKSGEIGTEKLLVHLKTKSSLADFLGTAPLLADQA